MSLQVKVWRSDGAELHLSSSDQASQVLGVLGESVVCLLDLDRVRISHPVNGTESVATQLEGSAGSVTPVTSVALPKRGKVLVVSEEGFLYQVC